MFDRLVAVENRYEQVQHDLQNPSVASDQTRYRSLMKESADLTPVVTLYRRFRKLRADRDGTKEMLLSENDESLREMAKQELSELEAELATVEAVLKIALLPKDPNDDKNVILEVRPAAGGDEAALFTDELFRAYALYAAQNGWKVDIMSRVEGNVGGAKEVIASIEGDKVFSKLKHEGGVHRVQRVPKTETQGRVHNGARPGPQRATWRSGRRFAATAGLPALTAGAAGPYFCANICRSGMPPCTPSFLPSRCSAPTLPQLPSKVCRRSIALTRASSARMRPGSPCW